MDPTSSMRCVRERGSDISAPPRANPSQEKSSASRGIWLAENGHNFTKTVNKKDSVNESQMVKSRARKEIQGKNYSYVFQRQLYF